MSMNPPAPEKPVVQKVGAAFSRALYRRSELVILVVGLAIGFLMAKL